MQVGARQTTTSVVSDDKKVLAAHGFFIKNVIAARIPAPQTQLFLEFREHRFSNPILSLEFCKDSEVGDHKKGL